MNKWKALVPSNPTKTAAKDSSVQIVSNSQSKEQSVAEPKSPHKEVPQGKSYTKLEDIPRPGTPDGDLTSLRLRVRNNIAEKLTVSGEDRSLILETARSVEKAIHNSFNGTSVSLISLVSKKKKKLCLSPSPLFSFFLLFSCFRFDRIMQPSVEQLLLFSQRTKRYATGFWVEIYCPKT